MVTSRYLWDYASDNLLMETDENDEVIVKYEHEPTLHGALTSMTRDGNTNYYYHYDGEGNTVAVTDEDDDLVEEAQYTAFGEIVQKTSSIGNPFGYKGALGYYSNPETSDFYVRARSYGPKTARWLVLDPLGFVDGLSLYAFVMNNPINQRDPSGLAPELRGRRLARHRSERSLSVLLHQPQAVITLRRPDPAVADHPVTLPEAIMICSEIQAKVAPNPDLNPEGLACCKDYLTFHVSRLGLPIITLLKKRQCDYRITCTNCPHPRQRAYTIADTVLFCANNLGNLFDYSMSHDFIDTIEHELIHVLQNCDGLKANPKPPANSCLEFLIREIEAYYCAGECDSLHDCMTSAIRSSCGDDACQPLRQQDLTRLAAFFANELMGRCDVRTGGIPATGINLPPRRS